jgi:hypothetical protein
VLHMTERILDHNPFMRGPLGASGIST